MTTAFYVGNDHTVRLLGLQNEVTLSYIVDATVSVSLLTAVGGAVVANGGPVSMAYIAPGSVGGTGTDTVVEATAKAGATSVTVTVGATNALSLAAADWVRFHGYEGAYRVAAAASGSAGASVKILLDSSLPAKLPAGTAAFAVDGVYEGVLQDTADVASGTQYWAAISIDATTEGIQGLTHVPVIADDRGA